MNATIEDFVGWINYHLEQTVADAHAKIMNIRSEANRHGMLHSSVAASQIIEACKEQTKVGADLSVGEFNRIKSLSDLDPEKMYAALSSCLAEFGRQIEGLARERARNCVRDISAYEPAITSLRNEIDFALRHAQTGFLAPPEPPIPPTMSNKITIESMIGGAIQQGTTGSTQNVTIKIDMQAAQDAIAQAEEALKSETANPEILASISADLDTIKAQLRKPEPSTSILVEAGRSLRTIAEGAAAGVLGSKLTTALVALGHALGL